MFRHIVLLTLDEDVPTATAELIVETLRRLPDQIPELRDYRVGRDVGLSVDNATIGVVADFDDVAGYEVYRDHPAHRAVITETIAPVLSGRVAVQIDL